MRGLILTVLAALAFVPALAREITAADLEAFADGVIESTMEREHVPGVVLGVVANGQVVLLKGYGVADDAAGVPVNPETTLFRPGSVTKLFTWVALAQLEAQGKVDLDTDINVYLAGSGVTVPDTFPEPITLKHLMTHTPGFEDLVLGLFGRDASSIRPLEDLLKDEMPARMWPPGTYASYSNHGVALAGLIVQQVSGEPWADYIEHHIIEPLGMSHTTVLQPLPASLAPDMSMGYEWKGGKYVEQPFEFVPAAPAGGASASGGDMLRLIQAFLNDGEYEGARILSASANHAMQQALFRSSDADNGLMHGFYETSSHGQFIIGHGGDTLWFHSELTLLPARNVGWFISTNSSGGPRVRAEFQREFLDRYFGRPEIEPVEFKKSDLAKLVGYYVPLRHAYTDFTKLIALLGSAEVSESPDHQLMLSGGGPDIAYMDEIAPGVFKNPRSEGTVTFTMDGDATYLHLSSMPVIALKKMTGTDSPSFHKFIITVSIVVFLWILVVWTIQQFIRRFVLPVSEARFRTAAYLLALTVVVFVIAMSGAVANPNDVVFGMSNGLKIVLLVPYVVGTLAVITLLLCPLVLRDGSVGGLGKVGYLLVAVTGLAFTWFLAYWQLL